MIKQGVITDQTPQPDTVAKEARDRFNRDLPKQAQDRAAEKLTRPVQDKAAGS